MKTKLKLRKLKILLVAIFLINSHLLLAQTNTSPTQTVCAGSLAEPYLINPPTTGSTYQWSISGGGVINPGTTSDNITVDWGVSPGTYTITVIETDANGCLGSPVTVDVTVNPLPTATTASNQTACFGSSIPDLVAIGSNVTWYSDAALTTVVGTGNNLATGQTTVGVYTYYVTESLNGCEGPAISVTLEIYALPIAPTASNQTACFGSSIPDLTASGSNVTWYSDAALTTVVGTGNNLATGQTAAGVYTYYATNTDVNGCESSAISVTLTINSFTTIPTASNQTACFGSSIPDLSASGIGTSFTWYSDAGLTVVAGTGSPFSTGQTAVGIYTYYVTESQNGCESPAATVVLEIYSIPNTGPINHW